MRKYVWAIFLGFGALLFFADAVSAAGVISQGITVTTPKEGDVWSLGSTRTITWYDETGASMARNVNIALEPYFACLYASPPCAILQVAPYTIATNIQSTGTYNWSIPTSLGSRFQGAMRVTVSTVDGALSGTSGVFTVAAAGTTAVVRTGYVDSASSTKVEGWAYDQNAQPACVTVSYENILALAGNSLNMVYPTFAQQACPSVARPDAEDWIKKNFGTNLAIQQPLGFVANPSGAISVPGTYYVKSVVLSSSGVRLDASAAAQGSFVIGGTQSSAVVVTGSPSAGTVGQAYSAEFKASGGTNRGFAWQLASGALPTGLYLAPPEVFYACDPVPNQPNSCPDNTERIVLLGAPTQVGTYTFQLRATDNGGNSGTSSFTVSVGGSSNGLTMQVFDPLTGVVGTALSKRLGVSGGTAPYSWTIAGGSLPDGLTMTFPVFNCITTPCVAPKDEMYISGTPTKTGQFSFTLKVTDSSGKAVFNTYTFGVLSASGQTSITVTSPSAGDQWSVGQTYTISWTGSNGDPVKILLQPQYSCNMAAGIACPAVMPAPLLIAQNVTGTSFAWSVPISLANTKLFGRHQIIVETTPATAGAARSGISGVFTIIANSISEPRVITVLSPQKDETWLRGKSYIIRWAPSTPGSTVAIAVTRYIACLHSPTYICAVAQPAPVTIADGIADTGAYTWTVPSEFTTTGTVTVSVSNYSTRGQGESAPFQISDNVATACPLTPGQLVVGSVGTVYIVTSDCHKYGFTSYQDFVSRGYKFSQVVRVDQGILDSIREVYVFARPAGSSFKYAGQPAIYYLTSTLCKQWYPSLTTLRAWKVNLADIVTISLDEQYPDCNPNFVSLPENAVVRTVSDGTVYVIRSGFRYPFASLGAFVRQGFSFSQVLVVRREELNLYALGGVIE